MTYANYQTTRVGDKIVFRAAGPHWFTNRVENAQKLEPGTTYTVSEIRVASSSTAVRVEEMGELDFELSWFDHPNPHPPTPNAYHAC